MNKVLLIGEIKEASENGFIVETVREYIDRDGETVKNATLHEVIWNGDKPKGRVRVSASMKQVDTPNGSETKIVAHAVNKATKAEKDDNIGMAQGFVNRPYQYFPAAEGKVAFGNVQLRTEDNAFHRGIVFGNLAHRFSRTIKKGAEVLLLGNIQHREYQDRNGKTRVALEILGDEEETKMLKPAPEINRFEGFVEEDNMAEEAI